MRGESPDSTDPTATILPPAVITRSLICSPLGPRSSVIRPSPPKLRSLDPSGFSLARAHLLALPFDTDPPSTSFPPPVRARALAAWNRLPKETNAIPSLEKLLLSAPRRV